MYTITTGGSSTDSRNSNNSRTPSRDRSYSSDNRGERGGDRGGYSRGGRSSSPSRGGYASRGGNGGGRAPFNAKRGFKKDFIDEKLFINKEAGVTETNNYEAKHKFTDFGIAEMLSVNLTAKGLATPSPIQDQAIPVVLEGKDVIGIASTGTGKTAAFLIPLINKLVADSNHKLMILTPTRELAMQVEAEFVAFTRGMKLFSV